MNDRATDDARRCFACGAENPIGLRLHFNTTDEGVEARFTPRWEHQGWDGIVHGGIVMTLLDEALAYAAFHRVGPVVTASLDGRLRRPCKVGQAVTIRGRIVSERRGLLLGESRVFGEDGELIAEARGKLVRHDFG